MDEDVLKQVKQQSIYPDDLMAEISQTKLMKPMVISVVAHALFILITSIAFIGLCMKYDTMDPRASIEQEKKELKEQEKAAAVDAAKTTKTTTSTPASADSTDAGTNTNGGDGTSPIEQAIDEVKTDYPPASDVGFDAVDSLE